MKHIPYEAIIFAPTGDVQFKIHNTIYFDHEDIWQKLDNFDIVSEDQEIIVAVGSMTQEQFKQLVKAN